jgi:hypothetical protein
MKPNPELLAAYQATTYYADLPKGRAAIRIGERQHEVDELLVENEAGSWIFITACNPLSEQLATKENRKRLNSLEQVLKDRGITHFHGEGLGDSGVWPCEPSFLVLGLNLEEAIALGREQGQHAVVFGRFNKPAQLVWCNE